MVTIGEGEKVLHQHASYAILIQTHDIHSPWTIRDYQGSGKKKLRLKRKRKRFYGAADSESESVPLNRGRRDLSTNFVRAPYI